LFKGSDGLNGANGVAGVNGSNGQTSYLHTAYATNSTGTSGFSTTNPTNATYIGTYVDFTEADSTTPASYSWVLFKGSDGLNGATGATGATGAQGPQGIQGIQGPAGANGTFDAAARAVLTGTGGVVGGSLTWDTNGARTSGTGVALTSKGIVAHNGTNNTFVIDGTTGNATFSGSLNAASGTFRGTLTAEAINAVNTINIAGDAVTVITSAIIYYSEELSVTSEKTIQLGTLTTSTEGQGRVLIMWLPSKKPLDIMNTYNGYHDRGMLNMYRYDGGSGALSFSIKFYRNNVLLSDQSISSTGNREGSFYLNGFVDTPGPGVACTYKIVISSSVRYRYQIRESIFIITEAKK
jgi:hypothetical protein